MGIVRFALKFPYTFYALAAFIVFLGALQAVEDNLLLKDEFVLRYDIENPSDGLPAGGGAFLACSHPAGNVYKSPRAFLSLAFPMQRINVVVHEPERSVRFPLLARDQQRSGISAPIWVRRALPRIFSSGSFPVTRPISFSLT